MNSKKFRFPYSIQECKGIIRHVDQYCYVVQVNEDEYDAYDVRTHQLFGGELTGKNFHFTFHYNNCFYFTHKENGIKQCFKYSYQDCSLESLTLPSFIASRVGIRNEIAFFRSHEGIHSVPTKNFDSFEKLPLFDGVKSWCKPALGKDALVFFYEYQKLGGFSLEGEQLWTKSLEDFDVYPKPDFWSSTPQFGRFVKEWKNYAIFEVKPFQAICIDMTTGEQRWVVEHCVDFQYCVADGVLYGIANGIFTSVDIETGEVILSVPIEQDWIQRGVNESRPITAVKATRTHLWTGFAQGQGVVAINRETGQIDHQEFVGRSVNLYPEIRGNQIYISLATGGMGLNTQSGGNYVLIGEGGFIEDEDKEIFY